jgi:AcrR family transcriptional regulator
MPAQPPPQRQRTPAPAEVGAAAIRFLAEHGFESTTAGELADAVGMSRSTFFRRFGSKDDVIFADHDLALARLGEFLGDTDAPAEEALTRATVDVLHLLTRDAEAAQLRSQLLRRTPALRERELVITHRYERVYTDYLSRVAAPGTPAWVPVALASAMVAVHNAALRSWLRDPDPRAASRLDDDLRALVSRFSPWLGGAEGGSARVVIAAFDADASPEEVLRAVEERLR